MILYGDTVNVSEIFTLRSPGRNFNLTPLFQNSLCAVENANAQTTKGWGDGCNRIANLVALQGIEGLDVFVEIWRFQTGPPGQKA